MKFYSFKKERQGFGLVIFPFYSPPQPLPPIINDQSLMVVYDILKKIFLFLLLNQSLGYTLSSSSNPC